MRIKKFLLFPQLVIVGLVISFGSISGIAQDSNGTYPDGLRKWTPATSAEVSYYSYFGDLVERKLDTIFTSPDGEYFWFISQRGNLARDCNVYRLSVYSVSDVIRSMNGSQGKSKGGLSPLRKVEMCNKRAAIEEAKWVDNGAAIEFLGYQSPSSQQEVYRLTILSGELKRLVEVPKPKELYGYSRQGRSLIYTLRERKELPNTRYPIYSLDSKRIEQLAMFGERNDSVFSGETFVSNGSQPKWKLHSEYVQALGLNAQAWFSPDGKRALMVRKPVNVPATWAGYERLSGKSRPVGALTEYVWIDLEKKIERSLLNAPTGFATTAGSEQFNLLDGYWSNDGGSVVLSNTTLPLTGGPSDDERTRMSYVVSYDVASRRWEILEPYRLPSGERVTFVGWFVKGKELLVIHSKNGSVSGGTIYIYNDGKWHARRVDQSEARKSFRPQHTLPVEQAKPARGLSVELVEGPNQPPRVVARLDGSEVVLTESDPALNNVWVAPTIEFKWKDVKGVERTSGLIMPREMPKDGTKIPLVIQIGGYHPNSFRPDGPTKTAHAAQALAAQGMAVLQFSTLSPNERSERADDLRYGIDAIDSVTAALANAYPVDLGRVGMLGFSRTGYWVRYLITNPSRLRPAAAVIADSLPGSFDMTLAMKALDNESFFSAYDPIYGGNYFYDDKQAWLQKEVSFNVDKVQTPVLFAENSENLLHNLHTIGSFKAANKPFEFLLLPEGEHQLLMPRQREASMTATTDWMAFWLLGKEIDPDTKSDRYAKWRELRKLHEKNQREFASKSAASSAAKLSMPLVPSERQKVLDEMKVANIPVPPTPNTLNRLGYKTLYEEKDAQRAIRYFQWNIILFPTYAAHLTDSLAEGFLQASDVAKAIEYYIKALAANPKYPGSEASALIVERLKADSKNIGVVQEELRKAYMDAIKKTK